MSTHFDIVIVGAGMVGLALANRLSRLESEPSIALLSAEAASVSNSEWDPRVVALSPSSRELLEACEAWQSIEQQRLCPYQRMYVWDGEGTAKVEFEAEHVHADALGYIVENRVVCAALESALYGQSRVKVIEGARVEQLDQESECSYLTCADGRQFSAQLVLAADGANSSLRALLDLPTREWDYQHTAIVTTIGLERRHEFCAWQRFSSDGPLAFLPLDTGEGHTASIVWSLNTDRAEQVLALDDEAFASALEREIESRFGKLSVLDKRYGIPLRQRHAKRYVRPGFALLGDAAHTIHPLAGQGVNLGFYDVHCLSEEVARAGKRNIPLYDYSIVQRYERQRQVHNLAAMATMEGFKRLFASDSLILRSLRNEGMAFVDRSKLLKRSFANLAAGKAIF